MTESTPKVSVIVPNFRHARYLPERLDSIFAQTFQDFEVIILDDASPDNSREVIARYLHRPKVTFFPNDRNSGDPFAQWNKGIGYARGSYLWIAESDDFAEPDFLEILVDVASRHPSAGIVYCNSDLVDESSRPVGDLSPHYDGLGASGRWDHDFFARGSDEVVQFLALRNTIPNASACLFQADVLREIGGAATGFRLCGDWMTYIQILERADIAYTARILNHFRVHRETARSASESDVSESLETYRVLNVIADRFSLSPARRALASAIAFERFNELVSSGPTRNLPLFSGLCAQASKFDTSFAYRINSPSWGRRQIVAAYFGGVNGGYSQDRIHIASIPSGVPWSVRLGPCYGVPRLDPAATSGLHVIHRVAFVGSNDEVLWRADHSTRFSGIELAGTATSVPDPRGLGILSLGDDPIIHFPRFQPPPTSAYFLEAEITAGANPA